MNKFELLFHKRRILSRKDIWGGEKHTFRDLIDECFDIFLSDKEKRNVFLKNLLEYDIIQCYERYGSTPQEYFLFGFRRLPASRREAFLTNQHKDKVMIEKVGIQDKYDMLENKFRFYGLFGKFFNRDVCVVRSEDDKTGFSDFCRKHKKFIVKPLYGQCGKNVRIISSSTNPRQEFERLLASGEWIVEELIRQMPAMARWNSSSVNTVRIPSFMNSSGFHILKPFIRFGRSGSIVDNANSGGIFCVVDEATGKLNTNGFDLRGNEYVMHPDSGITFRGEQIPLWTELTDFIREVHGTVPDYPYIGWDCALSDKGWCLIEGNWGQFDSESADKEGIKQKFDSLFD